MYYILYILKKKLVKQQKNVLYIIYIEEKKTSQTIEKHVHSTA